MHRAVGTGRSSPETLRRHCNFMKRAVGTCRSSPAKRTSGNVQSCWHWPKQPRNMECLESSSSCKKLFALTEAASPHTRTVKTLRKHCNFMKRAVGTCRSSPLYSHGQQHIAPAGTTSLILTKSCGNSSMRMKTDTGPASVGKLLHCNIRSMEARRDAFAFSSCQPRLYFQACFIVLSR